MSIRSFSCGCAPQRLWNSCQSKPHRTPTPPKFFGTPVAGLHTNLIERSAILRAICVLGELVEVWGAPLSIRLDNDAGFIAHVLAESARCKCIDINHIQPGKPTQNAYVVRCNKTYRTKVLDSYAFDSLQEVRQMTGGCLYR